VSSVRSFRSDADRIHDDPTKHYLLIFDFDGVIADSEVLSNTVLAETISALGLPTTVDDCYRLYMGKRVPEIAAVIGERLGRTLGDDFIDSLQAATFERFRRDLCVVAGARDYIDAFADLPRCIASSSAPARLSACLDILGLTDRFGENVFSAESVARGKPHPDIFLHAAATMGVEPSERCIVIEDSAGGVQAARAAGMTAIGLTAASHIRDGHAARLKDAGAHHVVATFEEARAVTRVLLGQQPP
jgi:HAD superfamily hydrolase (TIGR01509 family)